MTGQPHCSLPLPQWNAEKRLHGRRQRRNNVALWKSKTGPVQFHELNLLRRGTSTKFQLAGKGATGPQTGLQGHI